VHRRPLDGGAAPAEPARVGALPLAGAARHRELPLTKRRPLESIAARGRTRAETERVRASEGGGERGERVHLVGVGEGAEGADCDGGGSGEEEESAAEVSCQPPH